MGGDLFAELDREWERWCGQPVAAAAFARWSAPEPGIAAAGGLEELLRLFDRPGAGSHQARDAAMLGLIRLAPVDADAHRALLHVLRAGLMSLTARASRWWGWDEAASTVVTAAVDQVRRYPMRRTARVAANLLADVWHAVWVARRAELGREALGVEVGTEALAALADDTEPPAVQELLALVSEAFGRGRISRRDARLVVLHRVFGFTNPEVARLEGCRPCTVRKRRVAAEAAIAELAVA